MKPRRAITNKLVDLMKTITNGESALWFKDGDGNAVYTYPNFGPKGFPAVCILPNNNDPEFNTQLDNKRVYTFNLLLIEDGRVESLESVFEYMRELEDDVLAAIDNDYTLGGLPAVLDANYTLIDVLATPSSWTRSSINDVELLLVEIQVQVHINVTIN